MAGMQHSRRLLATALSNQADVNFQFLAFTTDRVPLVQADLANVIKNSSGTINALPVSYCKLGWFHVIVLILLDALPLQSIPACQDADT